MQRAHQIFAPRHVEPMRNAGPRGMLGVAMIHRRSFRLGAGILTLALGLIFAFPSSTHAHDIPSSVLVTAFIRPEGHTLRVVMRVPLEGGGRLVVEMSAEEASELGDALKAAGN